MQKELDMMATVNQSSMTGESMPVAKRPGSYVYAGTVVEEGQCVADDFALVQPYQDLPERN